MLGGLRQLDRILRGDATRLEDLRGGQPSFRATPVVATTIVLGVIYGACVGAYALTGEGPGAKRLLASSVKMPALFLLTTFVTLPSLYVYNALLGSRLTARSVARLLLASIAVTMMVAASQGPILVFFAVSTTSYAFMVLLNVVSLAIAGILGLAFLYRTLVRIVDLQTAEEIERARRDEEVVGTSGGTDADDEADDEGDTAPPPRTLPPRAPSPRHRSGSEASTTVFKVWLIVYGLVGTQMSWVLRPFIGHPDIEFSWFRGREGSFVEGFFRSLEKLLGG